MPDERPNHYSGAAQPASAEADSAGPVRLMTSGEIAKQLGVPVQRVLHVLRTRPYIEPRAIAGNARLFDREGVALIKREVQKIDARAWELERKAQKGADDGPQLF